MNFVKLPFSYLILLVGLLGVGLVVAPAVSLAQEDAADAGSGSGSSDEPEAEEPAPSAADEPAPAEEESSDPAEGDLVSDMSQAEVTDYTINTIIMFVCAVLVLFMQAGFAMLEVGLNSAKNTVNILFKNVMDLSVGVLLFLLIGYALMYPSDTIVDGWLGQPNAFIGRDAQITENEAGEEVWASPPTYSDGAPYASNGADFLFQVAFAATAATIVSGAVAGRMKFGAYLVCSER